MFRESTFMPQMSLKKQFWNFFLVAIRQIARFLLWKWNKQTHSTPSLLVKGLTMNFAYASPLTSLRRCVQ